VGLNSSRRMGEGAISSEQGKEAGDSLFIRGKSGKTRRSSPVGGAVCARSLVDYRLGGGEERYSKKEEGAGRQEKALIFMNSDLLEKE